ncbi:MAG: [FeFe] hydrogenase H-cluster radical SAM maturase HydE [Sedimentisphaerales bacterium]|nr:[FeFe] hydrogenase H-cluster radical SAM maturase HydE [Sedimentisphaerales bacterium]
MNTQQIIKWLKEQDSHKLDQLWQQADRSRYEHVGNQVHLRGLIEISNHCSRQCQYCGIQAGNRSLQRYRMTMDEILTCALQAQELGYGTVVLQAGEDFGLTTEWITKLIYKIKTKTALAITLSLGERNDSELRKWQQAGADRYLLRFETSDSELFHRIHPGHANKISDRFAILETLNQLGYETGSGVMIGIPGQTYDSLANDLLQFQKINLDMIGVGPFIPHPASPLGKQHANLNEKNNPDPNQVPNTELMTYKVVALTRLLCPQTNIPSTTALASLNQNNGRELGLQRGANVVMPNLTPLQYRKLYEIYPAKACLQEKPDDFHKHLINRITELGRTIGLGRGDSPHFKAKKKDNVTRFTLRRKTPTPKIMQRQVRRD